MSASCRLLPSYAIAAPKRTAGLDAGASCRHVPPTPRQPGVPLAAGAQDGDHTHVSATGAPSRPPNRTSWLRKSSYASDGNVRADGVVVVATCIHVAPFHVHVSLKELGFWPPKSTICCVLPS